MNPVRKEIGSVRIVPGPCEQGKYHRSQGTQVLMPDGTPIPRVYKVELVCEVDNVWRAVIHCHAQVHEIAALADMIETVPYRMVERAPWWKRLLDSIWPSDGAHRPA